MFRASWSAAAGRELWIRCEAKSGRGFPSSARSGQHRNSFRPLAVLLRLAVILVWHAYPCLTDVTTRMTVFVSHACAILRGTALIKAKYGGLRFESSLFEV
jgi:hypothetical protein